MAGHTRGIRTESPQSGGQGRGVRHNRLIAGCRLLRLGTLALLAAVVAGAVATSASAALFFLFKPTAAKAGELVTVRLGGTPPGFTLEKREKPFQKAMRLYLLANDVAGEVSSRADARLHFIGRLLPDRNGRGVLSFRVPPLDTAPYAVAVWCPGCARNSFGRTFFVLPVLAGGVGRFRHLQLLHVRMPAATETCPVTGEGTYGNGLLSVTLPTGGVLGARREPGGTLFQKLGWLPHTTFPDALKVRGERLDAPSAPLHVRAVRWGYSSSGRGGWASAVDFPSEGCWRISGRIQDISISYVVKVVATP